MIIARLGGQKLVRFQGEMTWTTGGRKVKAARNLFGKSRAAPSHNSRYEVAITVLTPAIAKRAHPALAWLLRIVAKTCKKRQSGGCKI
jgi:hypothetical protein